MSKTSIFQMGQAFYLNTLHKLPRHQANFCTVTVPARLLQISLNLILQILLSFINLETSKVAYVIIIT